MMKSVLAGILGVTMTMGALNFATSQSTAAILDSDGLKAAKAMQSASDMTGTTATKTAADMATSKMTDSATSSMTNAATSKMAGTSDMQNATGGAVIDGVGAIPVGASVPDMKMQEVGTSSAVATDAGTVEVIERSCTSCHGMAPVCAAIGQKDASQWAVTVQKMVNLGAELAPSEQAAVVGYLAGQAPNSAPLCK